MDVQAIASRLPKHLRRYIVDQDYSHYTPIDQACWRYIMRRLTFFLSKNAHECYMEGLKKTGIEVDKIPDISKMDDHLSKFGWHALPVSGFIPPAAFMELQSLSILPIASDMRSIEHTLYTPAPDIVHEAAGHAPILIDPNFANYLKNYAQIARKSIISSEDLELYEAIRNLSDIKEAPKSTKEEIRKAEDHLDKVAASMTHVSEAGLLSRMNWWTAEYGLIGDLKNPKIFGAGLLSSVSESQSCLSLKVKKIPFSIDCIKYSYNITEPQPQLFITESFAHLNKVLDDLANTMAFKTGGLSGLQKALAAKTINTAEYSTGIQVSGILHEIITDPDESTPFYLIFRGPCTLSYQNKLIPGHGTNYHSQGYGSPVGKCDGINNLKEGKDVELTCDNGVKIAGKVEKILRHGNKITLVSFSNCTVTHKGRKLFEPSWGQYDMAVGENIRSVFGGPADREAFDDQKDFAVKMVPRRKYSEKEKRLLSMYSRVKEIREIGSMSNEVVKELMDLSKKLSKEFPTDWLLQLEIFEIANKNDWSDLANFTSIELKKISKLNFSVSEQIDAGLKLAANN